MTFKAAIREDWPDVPIEFNLWLICEEQEWATRQQSAEASKDVSNRFAHNAYIKMRKRQVLV
jgi:hypothetical protein